MKIQILNKSNHDLPAYKTPMSAGMDIMANLKEDVVLMPGERMLFPTGIYVALPEGYELQVRPRSGLALKHGITVLNTPGCVDADYRGEIGVVLINHGNYPFEIKDGDRIAQIMVEKVECVEWQPVSLLSETERGEEGFGHTGVK